MMYRHLGQDNSDIAVLPISYDAPPASTPTLVQLYQAAPQYFAPIPYDQISEVMPPAVPRPTAIQPAPAVPARSGSYVSTAPPVASSSLSSQLATWLNTGQNKLYAALGGVIFVVAAVAGKKRRR